MPTLTLCMIVRDEAGMLADCLASVTGAVDHILIADTGSTDDTVSVARAHGARVVHVPWTDDFSAARNAVLEHADSDWVLVLDADERLGPDAGAAIRRAIERDDLDAAMLPLHHADALDALRQGADGRGPCANAATLRVGPAPTLRIGLSAKRLSQ